MDVVVSAGQLLKLQRMKRFLHGLLRLRPIRTVPISRYQSPSPNPSSSDRRVLNNGTGSGGTFPAYIGIDSLL